ncbi:hypothetical protein ACJX0J_021451, partial [Zea mays]
MEEDLLPLLDPIAPRRGEWVIPSRGRGAGLCRGMMTWRRSSSRPPDGGETIEAWVGDAMGRASTSRKELLRRHPSRLDPSVFGELRATQGRGLRDARGRAGARRIRDGDFWKGCGGGGADC